MMEIPNLLVEWYAQQGRRISWRETHDPYQIWVAETIFQQTRLEQGEPYLRRFLERFPAVEDLAIAPVGEVLKFWEGLGYYARARNMHAATRQVVQDFAGRFPQTIYELSQLKGVGPYTSRAIASFAFGLPVGVLDGNVARVAARILALPTPVNEAAGKSRLQTLVDEWAAQVDSRIFNFALMDLGATCCTPLQPACGFCPLQRHCRAWQGGAVHLFPVKKTKAPRKARYFDFFLFFDDNGRLAIRQRPNHVFWGGLWELPNIETDSTAAALPPPPGFTEAGRLKHVFTHFDMRIRILCAENSAQEPAEQAAGSCYIDLSEIPIFAFSKAVHKIFAQALPDGKIRTQSGNPHRQVRR